MRNLIPILLALVVLSSGCDPDGYSCNSEGCYSDDNSPQYQTLEDCLSVCDEITPAPGNCGDLVSHEGYNYSTVQIGDQCWFSENCRYLSVVSPSTVGADAWSPDYEPYYYVYGYEGTNVEAAKATANYETYGVLYNWHAVRTEGICPSGWHVASNEDFEQLIDFFGGVAWNGGPVADLGGMMKEAGYDHWESPNTGATNSCGFTGLPGGYRAGDEFSSIGYTGYWWSSPEQFGPSSVYSYSRQMLSTASYISKIDANHLSGLSARCVRD